MTDSTDSTTRRHPSTDESPSDRIGPPVVTVDDVGRSFGETTVLDGLSLTLGRGETVALVGPNGSGKTTLLEVVAGVHRPDEGRVTVATDRSPAVGYLPQNPAFRSSFTVAETLGFYADLVPHEVDVEATLRRVGLGAVADRRIDALSGGMVRLVGLAQATVGDPPVLVLDEPTSGLDPRMTAEVYDTVADLAAGDRTVVLSTHDLDAAEVVDRLVVLDEGRVVVSDTPAGLRAKTNADTLREAFVSVVGRDPTVQAGRDNGTNSNADPGVAASEDDPGVAANGGERQ
jgi:ABC-2 type transport system ATP-binding protein